jgi:hypothetical protein
MYQSKTQLTMVLEVADFLKLAKKDPSTTPADLSRLVEQARDWGTKIESPASRFLHVVLDSYTVQNIEPYKKNQSRS